MAEWGSADGPKARVTTNCSPLMDLLNVIHRAGLFEQPVAFPVSLVAIMAGVKVA
ncbi:hypothetical protein M2272_002658 [Mycobacterium frederiksbergense]|uniref:Uncharacterized protein n=1 Tax=Mycolicibacterium frederiksbergense TaxID=117567 RepID=A0ABT6KZ92_9MYCO|nr:hypothetical protein [Mycolicibacterium frederiksbergense]MDH6196018.1 hypothetical protein [Mycolicibacterium frederiksbergense]